MRVEPDVVHASLAHAGGGDAQAREPSMPRLVRQALTFQDPQCGARLGRPHAFTSGFLLQTLLRHGTTVPLRLQEDKKGPHPLELVRIHRDLEGAKAKKELRTSPGARAWSTAPSAYLSEARDAELLSISKGQSSRPMSRLEARNLHRSLAGRAVFEPEPHPFARGAKSLTDRGASAY